MDGEYSYEWAELRKIQRRMLKAFLGIIPIVLLLPLADGVPLLVLAIFGLWVFIVGTLFISHLHYLCWSCPRCGKPFHLKMMQFGRRSNYFGRRCIHCGLAKWAQSDPDPILKRYFYPFRTDSLFKLGDTRRGPDR